MDLGMQEAAVEALCVTADTLALCRGARSSELLHQNMAKV
jgi:hypothetical protein